MFALELVFNSVISMKQKFTGRHDIPPGLIMFSWFQTNHLWRLVLNDVYIAEIQQIVHVLL